MRPRYIDWSRPKLDIMVFEFARNRYRYLFRAEIARVRDIHFAIRKFQFHTHCVVVTEDPYRCHYVYRFIRPRLAFPHYCYSAIFARLHHLEIVTFWRHLLCIFDKGATPVGRQYNGPRGRTFSACCQSRKNYSEVLVLGWLKQALAKGIQSSSSSCRMQ